VCSGDFSPIALPMRLRSASTSRSVRSLRPSSVSAASVALARTSRMPSASGAAAVPYGDGVVERVRALYPDGVDAVLDLVGGQALDDSPALVRDPTRICSIIDPQRALDLGGSYHFCRPDSGQLATLAEWVDGGRLRIDVGRTLSLAEAAEAQRLQEQGGVRGKIVLTV
jgi:NADPH:quinone reductase-like Zn-dependent oxidoreductase